MKCRTHAYKKVSDVIDRLVGVVVQMSVLSVKDIEQPHIEDSVYETDDWISLAYRLKTGFEGKVTHYTEVRITKVGRLVPKDYPKLCSSLHCWKAFNYRQYYENRFACINFIVADKMKGVLKPLKIKDTLYVPLRVKDPDDAVSVACMYLANFFNNRVTRFLNSLLKGRVGKPRSLWWIYRSLRRGVIESLGSAMRNSINYIIETSSEVKKRFNSDVSNTVISLLNPLKFLIDTIDKIERPRVLERRAKKVVHYVKKEMKANLVAVRKILAKAINYTHDIERGFAKSYLEKLYNAKPII